MGKPHDPEGSERSSDGLEKDLLQARKELEYYKNLAHTAGVRRLREIEQLSQLVNEKKLSEKMIARERAQLLSIFDTIDGIIYVCDPATCTILYVNRKAREIYGDTLGKKCDEAFENLNIPCPNCTNKDFLKESPRDTRVWERTDPVSQRTYRCSDRPLHWPDGRTVRFQIAVDVTDEIELEKEVILRQKMESIGMLAGGIAHDFNNLLTAIMGNVSLIPHAGSQEDFAELLEEINNACIRARELNNQLLTFSKGGAPVKKASPIQDTVKDTTKFVLRGSNVRPSYHISSDLWIANIDPAQISQVVQNIVMNADEAMPDGGVLDISAANCEVGKRSHLPLPPGRYVRVSFTDHGCGIPEEHLQRVFEPYFTTKLKGHGLGLASSYAVIEKHGGHIAVSSRQGYGTSFIIHLSASEIQPEPAEPAEPEENEEPANNQTYKARILLMDDELAVRRVVVRFVETLGLTAVATSDGAEAVEAYRDAMASGSPFDIVITDMTVPGGMGGLETLHHILELDPKASVIVSSGYSHDEVLGNYRELGFAAVLKKPYELTDISDVLTELLASTRS